MRVVVALGGNALLQRGQRPDAEIQEANVDRAVTALAGIAEHHELVITHGNGPQVGVLALQSASDPHLSTPYPFDVLGAQKTCREFFFLAWQIYEFCVRNACEVEVFSMDRFAVFNGKWENDLEAAMYLFPNSNAWNPRGFQSWMEEYTNTHYQTSDLDMEGEPVSVEYVDRALDLDPAESDGYSAPPLAKCIAWIKRYPAIIAGQKAAVAREQEEREASYSA